MRISQSIASAALLVVLATAPLTSQNVAGPRAHAAQVGLHSLPPQPSPLSVGTRARRHIRNPGWLIGAVAGGALGAWFGHHYWRGDDRHAAPASSAAPFMIGFGLLAAAVGSVIGGVVGSR